MKMTHATMGRKNTFGQQDATGLKGQSLHLEYGILAFLTVTSMYFVSQIRIGLDDVQIIDESNA